MLTSHKISGIIKRFFHDEKGHLLPVVLILLAIGGLLIGVNLKHVSASLKNNQVIDEKIMGLYAADSGIENTLWYFKRNLIPPASLTETINDMEVNIEVQEQFIVTYTTHNDYLGINTTTEWIESVGAYKYTISVIWQPVEGTPEIFLSEAGAILPLGFEYQDGSVSLFPENLSVNAPVVSFTATGAQKLTWSFPSPRPGIGQDNPVAIQIFYIDETVPGSIVDNHYSWVKAQRSDVGMVSELSGSAYRILSRATRPEDGKITAEILAGLTFNDSLPYITSWTLLK